MSYLDTTTLLIFHGWRIVGALVCGTSIIGFLIAASDQIGLTEVGSDWKIMPTAAIIAAGGYIFWRMGNAGVKWHTRRGKTL
jgi:hypothetical protein